MFLGCAQSCRAHRSHLKQHFFFLKIQNQSVFFSPKAISCGMMGGCNFMTPRNKQSLWKSLGCLLEEPRNRLCRSSLGASNHKMFRIGSNSEVSCSSRYLVLVLSASSQKFLLGKASNTAAGLKSSHHVDPCEDITEWLILTNKYVS